MQIPGRHAAARVAQHMEREQRRDLRGPGPAAPSPPGRSAASLPLAPPLGERRAARPDGDELGGERSRLPELRLVGLEAVVGQRRVEPGTRTMPCSAASAATSSNGAKTSVSGAERDHRRHALLDQQVHEPRGENGARARPRCTPSPAWRTGPLARRPHPGRETCSARRPARPPPRHCRRRAGAPTARSRHGGCGATPPGHAPPAAALWSPWSTREANCGCSSPHLHRIGHLVHIFRQGGCRANGQPRTSVRTRLGLRSRPLDRAHLGRRPSCGS